MRKPVERRRHRRARAIVALLAFVGAAAGALAAPAAHEHGAARVDVAAEPGRLLIRLETPLENLVGFERAPRTDAERRQVDDALGRLRDAAALWHIDPAARCAPSASAALGTAALEGEAAAAGAGHAELDAEYAFACAGGVPAWVDTRLFAAFARLQRLDVQIAAPRGQARRTLRRGAVRIELPR